MTFKTLSPEETQRFFSKMQAHHDGKLEKPAYIDAWSEKINEATVLAAAAVEQKQVVFGDEDYHRFMAALRKMRQKMDRLMHYWVNETPYRSWDDLATGTAPTREELFFLTVIETEDYFNGPGIATFVRYLDKKYLPGIMKDFVHACLRDCDPILAEGIQLTPDIMRVFSYPEQVFGTTQKEVTQSRLYEWCRNTIPQNAASHVQRLFIANVLCTDGDHLSACVEIEYARAEAAEPRFAEYMTNADPATERLLTANQYWMIDMLLSIWHRDT